MAQATLSLSAISAGVAALAVKAKDLDTQAASNREETAKQIVILNKAKATVGRYNQCAVATAFMDGLTSGGIAKGTAKNYLVTFREAVKSGKFEGWNKSRADAKKGGGKGKGTAAFADLLLKAFNHEEGRSLQELCESIQGQYEDASVDSVYAGFVEYLRSEGYEIAE